MATLIELRNSDGSIGRCDAKCYEALDQQCTCVCKGRNHGAGLKQAQDNTIKMSKELLKKHGNNNIIFPDKGKQLQLF
ncbi:MAG: hypothetical protein NTY47_08310 [Candidatus Omnitrophica bacterium]|nr:hypothetical protein [Candidatus Omnitrophota bacterium]